MSSFSDSSYKKYLLPKRLIFFDLDGTIIPSTAASGRRIAISISIYKQVREFARIHFDLDDLPKLNENDCSDWYRNNGGPQGLIKKVLIEYELPDQIRDCLAYYFNGLFNRRLKQYLKDDLRHDRVPEQMFEFLKTLSNMASMVLVSYRYQTQFQFLNSIDVLGLTRDGVFGPNNAYAVGEPGSSSDGSKSRFVGGLWRREIRAQRRLTSSIGKTFPPIVIGDSVGDIHFAVDIGGVFFGVSETGEASHEVLVNEIKSQNDNLNNRSRIFASLLDEQLQRRILEECQTYIETVKTL